MPHNDRSRPGDDSGAAHDSVSGTKWSVPPGPPRLLIGGEWVDPPADRWNWRGAVNLADIAAAGDVPLAYACGVHDGIEQAAQLTREYAALVMDHREVVQAFERAERRYRRAS